MASSRDVINFKFLREALIQKYRRLKDPTFKTFLGIPYEPASNPNSIFGRLYGAFRELIQRKNLLLNQYLNLGDENVLEKLYLNLKTDPNLKFLDDPDSVLDNQKYELSESYYQNQSKELEDAQRIVSESTSQSQPASGISTLHPVSTPIRMQSIQQTATATLTKGETTETMESPQEEARQQQKITQPQAVPQAFTKAFEGEPEYVTDPTKKPPTLKPQLPKIPSAFSERITNLRKNLASKTAIFIKKNQFGVLSGFFAAAGGFIGGGIGGRPGVLFGVIGGALTPSLIKSGVLNFQPGGFFSRVGNGAINFGVGLSGNISGPRFGGGRTAYGLFNLGSTAKKVGLVLLFFGLFFGISLISAIFPKEEETPSAEASPQPPQSGILLDYTIPFRDTSVSPLDVRNQIKSIWPNAQIDNWDLIIQKSVDAKWNPAFVLTLWIEETGAQGVANYSDPLGCAPNQPTTDINISLTCLFNNFSNFTNGQFADFMARYSGGPAANPFANNPNFPKNIKLWYSILVPSGPGALTLISTQTAEALGCPTVGTITNPYGYNIPGQPNDIDYYGCGSLPGCHSGIDIAYGRGTTVSATFDGVTSTVSSDSIKGNYITVSNSQTGYSATFEHLDSRIVSQGETVKRGQVIGTMGATGTAYGVHLHYRLEKNGNVINPFRYLGPSASLATISLTQSDDIGSNNYQDKPASLNWGQCNEVP